MHYLVLCMILACHFLIVLWLLHQISVGQLDHSFLKNVLNIRKDVNINSKFCGYTALHRAAFDKKHNIVEILLKNGAEPLILNKFNESAWDIIIKQITPNFY